MRICRYKKLKNQTFSLVSDVSFVLPGKIGGRFFLFDSNKKNRPLKGYINRKFTGGNSVRKLNGIIQLYDYVKRRKAVFFGMLILSCIVAFFELIPVQLLGALVDVIGKVKLTSYKLIYVKIFGTSPVNLIIAFGIVYMLEGVFSLLYGSAVTLFNNRIIEDVRNDAFRWVMSGDDNEKIRVGDIISRITGDVEAVTRAIAGPLNGFLTSILSLIFSLVIFALWNIKLAAISAALAPVIYLLSKWVTKRSQELARMERKSFGNISDFLSDVLSNITLIKSYRTEKEEGKRFCRYNGDISGYRKSTMHLFNRYWPSVRGVQAFGFVATLLITYHGINAGRFSVGDILVVYTYLTKIYAPMILISRYGNELSQADAALERVFELKPKRNFISADKQASDMDYADKPLAVEFKEVSIKNDENLVIHDLSFSAKPGQLIAIIGESGSGKSTFINSLAGLTTINEGKIVLNNTDVSRDKETLKNSFRICFQNPYILKRSIIENLNYGNQEKSENLDELCEKLGIDEIIKNRGYDFKLDSINKNLSGGEQRRFALCRTLNRYAPAYAFDEPTAELDLENRLKVVSLLGEIKGKSTVFVATHDEELIKLADKVIKIDNGVGKVIKAVN